MLFWLDAMSHPDGNISFFNDSALSISPSINELYAYSKRLGLNIEEANKLIDLIKNCIVKEGLKLIK